MRIQKEKTIIISNLGNVLCHFYVVTKHLELIWIKDIVLDNIIIILIDMFKKTNAGIPAYS